MTIEQPDEPPQVVRDLVDGFNLQIKQSNKVWLALFASATVVLFPVTTSNGAVKLPFSLGLVDIGTYKIVGFLILAVLTINYCQAYAAAHNATRFAHATIDKLEPAYKRDEARKFFDFLIASSLARVAPLAELKKHPRLSAVYYVFLKLVAAAILFGIPLSALVLAFFQLGSNPSIAQWIYFLSLFIFIITMIAVLQLLYAELSHVKLVAKLYWTGQLAHRAD